VEAEILKHPAVSEVSVFGVMDPDGGDHIPRAVVVLKPGQKATPNEIRDFANGNFLYLYNYSKRREEMYLELIYFLLLAHLAEYKKLRGGVYLVDSLPRGRTGKVVRSAAAQLPLPPIVY